MLFRAFLLEVQNDSDNAEKDGMLSIGKSSKLDWQAVERTTASSLAYGGSPVSLKTSKQRMSFIRISERMTIPEILFSDFHFLCDQI